MGATRVVLVTGGARRVGRAISLALARTGMDVMVHYRSSSDLARQLVAELRKIGGRAECFQADLTDPAAARTLIDDSLTRLGRLDLLVNNAASFLKAPVLGSSDEEWERSWRISLETNLLAPARLARLAAPHLAATRGAIVNLVDINATMAWAGYSAHGASKAGLAHLTRTLAVALGPDVRVNGVSPGIALFPPEMGQAERNTLIEKTALRRAGTPEDIAQAVVFLASQEYTTGAILPVDGGWSVPK